MIDITQTLTTTCNKCYKHVKSLYKLSKNDCYVKYSLPEGWYEFNGRHICPDHEITSVKVDNLPIEEIDD